MLGVVNRWKLVNSNIPVSQNLASHDFARIDIFLYHKTYGGKPVATSLPRQHSRLVTLEQRGATQRCRALPMHPGELPETRQFNSEKTDQTDAELI